MTSQTFIDLSRWQFATTAAFHMTFPALSVGLAIFLVICYGAYCKMAIWLTGTCTLPPLTTFSRPSKSTREPERPSGTR